MFWSQEDLINQETVSTTASFLFISIRLICNNYYKNFPAVKPHFWNGHHINEKAKLLKKITENTLGDNFYSE